MSDNTNTETPAATTPAFTPREAHGVKEYRPGSVGANVWAIADAITQRKGEWASAAEVIEEGKGSINEGSIRAGYATWRKFNGLAGHRIDNPAKAEAKAKAEAEKAEKARVAAEAKAAKEAAAAEAKAAKEAEKAAKAEAKAAEKAAKEEAKRLAAEQKAAEKVAAAEAKAAAEANAPADPAA